MNDIWWTAIHGMRCDLPRHPQGPVQSTPWLWLGMDWRACDSQEESHSHISKPLPCRSFCLMPFLCNLLTILEQSHLFFKILSVSLLTVATVWPNYSRISRAPGEPLLCFLSLLFVGCWQEGLPFEAERSQNRRMVFHLCVWHRSSVSTRWTVGILPEGWRSIRYIHTWR